jgi:hypothetical protein
MAGEEVRHYKLAVGRKIDDRWGRIRIGSGKKIFFGSIC